MKRESIIFILALAILAAGLGAGFYFSSRSGAGSAGLVQSGASGTVEAAPQAAIPIPIPASATPAKIVAVPPLFLPYETYSFRAADWIKAWGNVSVANGALYLAASSSTTGADTFLAGSERWTNYDFQATIDWIGGTTFSVIAREADNNNFTYCDFGRGEATIIEKVAGGDKVIGSHGSPNGSSGAIYDFGIRVYGNKVACTVNGVEVAATDMLAGAPAGGGIGFIVWDPASSTAVVSIKNIAVTPLFYDNIAIPVPSVPSAASAAVAPTSSASQGAQQAKAASVPLPLPYVASGFANDKNWAATWGTLAVDPASGALEVAASSTTTGAVAVLRNSGAWTNYEFDATIDWVKGEEFGLIARYNPPNTYAECVFFEPSPDYLEIQLQQYINGSETTLAQGTVANYDPRGHSVGASMYVSGSGGTCSIGGHVVSNVPANSTVRAMNPPYSGGIGFAVWDPAVDNADTIISNVGVKSVN